MSAFGERARLSGRKGREGKGGSAKGVRLTDFADGGSCEADVGLGCQSELHMVESEVEVGACVLLGFCVSGWR